MLMLASFAIKVRLTVCVFVGVEADLGLELARRVCLRHDVRRGLDLEKVLCDDLSNDSDIFLMCS
jgi:hypothetical protein